MNRHRGDGIDPVTRSRARRRALQAIYAWQVSGGSVRDVIDKFYGDTGRYPETLDELVEKKYLRGLPVDPITESTATWQLVPVPEGYKGAVYDLHSGAQGSDREGKKYAEW